MSNFKLEKEARAAVGKKRRGSAGGDFSEKVRPPTWGKKGSICYQHPDPGTWARGNLLAVRAEIQGEKEGDSWRCEKRGLTSYGRRHTGNP